MICRACTEGGNANAEGREQLAADLHSKCANLVDSEGNPREGATALGTWCDCHHRTGGGHINREMIPDDSAST